MLFYSKTENTTKLAKYALINAILGIILFPGIFLSPLSMVISLIAMLPKLVNDIFLIFVLLLSLYRLVRSCFGVISQFRQHRKCDCSKIAAINIALLNLPLIYFLVVFMTIYSGSFKYLFQFL